MRLQKFLFVGLNTEKVASSGHMLLRFKIYPVINLVTKFMDMVNEKLENPKIFGCPCVDCKYLVMRIPASSGKVFCHLLQQGIVPTYI
ncbi:hypothetical protein MKW98_021419 [Papaver atlanticum]|uniref:Transposase-associated domain-containing protein n=1 Tax=Papaver atlanticum TaxID=357466 RepID=A0AAD4SSF0_9MAGN|nr:hypothetical protein MKW98_021419 [Papaver atlanticum]